MPHRPNCKPSPRAGSAPEVLALNHNDPRWARTDGAKCAWQVAVQAEPAGRARTEVNCLCRFIKSEDHSGCDGENPIARRATHNRSDPKDGCGTAGSDGGRFPRRTASRRRQRRYGRRASEQRSTCALAPPTRRRSSASCRRTRSSALSAANRGARSSSTIAAAGSTKGSSSRPRPRGFSFTDFCRNRAGTRR